MTCTLTKEQHIQFFKKIVSDLLAKSKLSEPVDAKTYIKDIYKKIFDKTGDPEIALTYASLAPKYMSAAAGLNTKTIGKLLKADLGNLIDLEDAFDKDISSVINYVAEEQVDQVIINNVIVNQPPSGPNIPPVNSTNLQAALLNRDSAIPSSMLTSTGQDSEIVDGKPNNVPNPNKIRTMLVRNKILSQMVLDRIDMGSELVYSFHKGFKLKVLNETQLPSNIADLGHEPLATNMVLAIVDNDGKFISFDSEGGISDKGEVIHLSFRLPNAKTITTHNKFITETLQSIERTLAGTLTPEELAITLKEERKALEEKRDVEIAIAKEILATYEKDPGANTLVDIIGGSLGYVNQPLKEKWTKTSDIKVTDNELKTVSYALSGNTTLRFEGVSKEIPIEPIPLDAFPVADIDNLVRVLTSPVSHDLTNQDKINYLKTFVGTKSGPKGKEPINIQDINGKVMLEIRGNLFKDVTVADPLRLTEMLLNNALYFNINSNLKATVYTDIQVSDKGVITKVDKKYTDLLSKYTKVKAIPNAEGKIVELNGYFSLSYSPEIDETGDVKKSEDLNQISEEDWDNVPLAANKLIELNTTPAQQEAAKTWWNNSPLSKLEVNGELVVPLEVLKNITNSNAFATWSIAGIKLYNGSDDTLLYHEAWHAFSQLFLTKAEKNKLYAETAKQSGTFKIVVRTLGENGEIIPMLKDVEFSKATKRQLEEYIAEAYRAFAIGRGATPVPVKAMKSIFRKIWEFIKAFFTGVAIQDTANDITLIKPLNDMFNALYVGDINTYSPMVENVSFSIANAGMLSIADINEERNHTDSKLIKESIDGLISKLIYERSKDNANWTIRGLTVNANKINLYNQVKKRLFNRYAELLQVKKDAGVELTAEEDKIVIANAEVIKNKTVKDVVKTQDDIQVLEHNIDLLNWTLVNFGDIELSVNNFSQKEVNSGVVGYHLINSEFNDLLRLSVKSEELDIDQLDGKAIASTERYGDKGPNANDAFDDADNQVVYLVKSLLKQNNEGTFELNNLGFPSLVDYTIAQNSMKRKIAGIPIPSGLYNKILEEAKTDIMYKQLAARIGAPGTGNAEQNRLWFKFTRTFSKVKQNLIVHIVESDVTEQGNLKILYKTGMASADYFKVKNRWQSEFKQSSAKENPFILQTAENTNYLNLPEVIKTFLTEVKTIDKKTKKEYSTYTIKGNRSNVILFLNAIGFYITPSEVTQKDIEQYTNTFKFLATVIGELNNRNIIEEGSVMITNPITDFAKQLNGLQKVTDPTGAISYKNTRISSQNPIITILAKVEAANSDKYSSTSRLNAEGEKQDILAKQATVSKRIYALQEATNINDFSNPESYFYYMSFLSKLNNPSAKASIFLNSLFSKIDGTRTGVTISLDNLGGTNYLDRTGNDTIEKGLSHASMSIMDKFISDFNMLLTTGVIAHPTTGGKSTHYSTKLSSIHTYPGKVQNHLFIDSAEFIANEQGNYTGSDKAFDIMLPYIQAELERIIKFNTNRNIYDKYKSFSDDTVGNFSIFDDILEDDTKDQLRAAGISSQLKKGIYPHNPTSEQLAEYHANKDMTLLKVLNSTAKGLALKEKIREEVKYYFDNLYNDNQANLMSVYGFISPQVREEIVNSMKGDKLDMTEMKDVSKVNDAALRSFTYNNWINTVEVTMLHNGEVTTYNHTTDEATKRYPLFQSSGDMFPTDQVSRDIINKLGTPLTNKVTGSNAIFDGTLNTAIIKDYKKRREQVYSNMHDLFKKGFEAEGLTGTKLSVALYGKDGTYDKPKGGKMKPYAYPTVTDGQGYMSLDTYRILKNLEGKWSDAQEALYKRIVAGESPSQEETSEYFPVYKLQMAGNLKTDLGLLPVTSGHKFALFPLIPNVIAGTPLEQLHIEMMKQGVHYVTHDSGSKLASITDNDSKEADDIFDGQTGQFKPGMQFTKNVIFADYLKNQTDVNTEFKGKATMSTQLRTLLSSGLIEHGIPVDFQKGVKLSDLERLKQWDALSEAEQMEASPFYKLVRTYEKRVSRLVDLKKDDLISKIEGWSKDPVTGNYSGPETSIIDFVKKELKDQGLTEHELSFIDTTGKGKLLRDLSGSPIADTLEKSLMALINNKILKQMVNGEPLVEVSVANTLQFKNINTAIEKYGNTDLKFYTADVNGVKKTTSCQVKIAMQGSYANLFNLLDNDGKKIAQYDMVTTEVEGVKSTKRVLNFEASRVRLNQLIIDESWLNNDDNRKKIRLTGVRIPVQGLNSMEYAEVAEFLPPSAGNIIILPAEIVAKSGTDFDVDKLTAYMATIGKSGKWLSDDYISREALNEEIKLVENQLLILLKEKTGGSDDVKVLLKNYRSEKKDKGLSIIELKLKRDALKAEAATAIADIRSFLKEKNTESAVYAGLEKIMLSTDDETAINIINGFKSKPPILSGETTSKAYDIVKQNSLDLKEIKTALKEGYDDQTNYLELNPEINELTNKYEELKDQKRNFIKAVENSLINDIISILELPENAIRLLTANDTHKAKPYADEMEPHVQQQNFKLSKRKNGKGVSKGVSPTRLMEYGFNLKKHEDNFVSKEALGIAALGNKGNSVYNSAGAYIPSMVAFKTKERQVDKEGISRTVEVQENVPTTIYLPTNKSTVIEDGKEVKVISLSYLYDSAGENEISEIISQLMNGYVDAEKDAWIAFIQGNKEVTPIILFLLEAGVPIRDLVYYVSNPLIRTYIQQLKINKGILTKLKNPTNDPMWAKSNAKAFVWNTLLKKSGKMPDMVKIAAQLHTEYGDNIFSTDKLQSIAKSDLTESIKDKDAVNGFLHYMYIEELARNFDEPRNKTNLDTTKSGSFFDVFSRQLLIDELYESTKMPRKIIKYIVETGPTSAFRTTELAQDLFGSLFTLRNHDILNTFLFDIEKDFAKIGLVKSRTGLDKEVFPSRFKNALMNYIFVNNLKSFKMGESTHYKGIPTHYMNTGNKPVHVKIENGKPVIHINENLLRREFKNQSFTKDVKGKGSYSEQGLATVGTNVFYKAETFTSKLVGSREYYDFVVEREYLRAIKPFDTFIDTYQFRSKFDKLIAGEFYRQKADESAEDFEKRASKIVYETYLRNTALENSFNFNTMFFNNQQAGIASYATTLISLINKYPNLEKKFSVLQQLSASYYSDEADKNKLGKNNFSKDLVNITLRDSNDLTPDSTAQYADDLAKLGDRSVNKTVEDTEEAREDNERLSDLFRKFPTYIFLQGGMNKNQFAFPSIFPANSSQSVIMNDAVVKAVKTLKWVKYKNESKVPAGAIKKTEGKVKYYASTELLQTVFDLFLKNNLAVNRKINQRKAAINYLALTPATQVKDLNKESIITKGDEFDRITPTSIEGLYTLDTKDLTDSDITNLADVYRGKAYFITDNETFSDTSIRLRTDSIDNIDENIEKMTDAMGSGIALVLNENGYLSPSKEVQSYLDSALLDKLGFVNVPLPVTKQKAELVPGTRIVNKEDVDLFKSYLKKSEGVQPKEFFTSKTMFKAFFNPETGKNEKAPQSAKWILNDNGLYDLTDKESGEVYIPNVDLSTGMSMTTKQPVSSKINSLSNFIGNSGAAVGGDTIWSEVGKEYGVNFIDHTVNEYNVLSPERKAVIESAYVKATKIMGRPVIEIGRPGAQLVRRDYLQAEAADSIFAISTFIQPGEKDKKGYTNKTKVPQVEGGTGYAVTMALVLGKPVYVFDQLSKQWFKADYTTDMFGINTFNSFVKSETPILTQNFAGIGTREINDAGKQAIRDVYQKTFSTLASEHPFNKC